MRGHLRAGLGAEQVRHVQQRPGLRGERLGHRRVGVAEAGHRQPGQEVEVAPAVGVPQLGALAPHERHRGGGSRHERAHGCVLMPTRLLAAR